MTGAEKITIRLPPRYLEALDLLVATDDFESRSEAIRHAVRDLIYERMEIVDAKIEKMQGLDKKLHRLQGLERDVLKP